MKQLTAFPNADLLLIKWKILFFVISVSIAAAIYLGVDYFYTQSIRAMNSAQAQLLSARSSVDLIEEEEARVIQYIDRYKQLSAQDIVEPEDRLQLLEKIAEIRSQFDLFPISLNISEQSTLRLDYDPSVPDPGGPLDLKSSIVEVALPLLHEEDMVRLLDTLLNSRGLYLTKNCRVILQNQSTTRFTYLSQHLAVNCELLWFTFDVSPSS